MNQRIQAAADSLRQLREQRPLVLSLTNSVVQSITANALLALGAVPAMLKDGQEAAEMLSSCANALLINVGTLDASQAEAMKCAVATAKTAGIPWVLDPVAVGLLSMRTNLCRELLKLHAPALIRGNASEIMALAGQNAQSRGPESNHGSHAAVAAAQELARRHRCAVLVSGETDYACDGKELIALQNGHPMMSLVTGIGCAMGAVAAAFCASCGDALQAAVSTALIWGIIGEKAAAGAAGPGSFAARLPDSAYLLTEEDVLQSSRLQTC